MFNASRALFDRILEAQDDNSYNLHNELSQLPKYWPIAKFIKTLDKYYPISTITPDQVKSIVVAFRR